MDLRPLAIEKRSHMEGSISVSIFGKVDARLSLFSGRKGSLGIGSELGTRRQIPVESVGVSDIVAHVFGSSISSFHWLRISCKASSILTSSGNFPFQTP